MFRLCILVAVSCLCAAGQTAADPATSASGLAKSASGLAKSASGLAKSASGLARSIREAGLDPGACYRVRDLDFQKEDIHVYLTEGYLIFSKPVAGERHSAVFTADVDGGDAEVLLFPPTRDERQSLAMFTQSANLDEHFSAAVMVFSGGAGSALFDRIEKEQTGRKSPEMGPLLTEKWGSVLTNVQNGFQMRILEDLLGPQPPEAMMFLALSGRQVGNFDLMYDSRSREQILAGQLTERNGRPTYNVWTNFAARSSRNAKPKPHAPWFTLSNFRIDAALDPELRMKAATRVTAHIGARPLRVFPFEISQAMKVTSAQIDGAPAELVSQESLSELQSPRGRALAGGDNEVFLVVAPEPLAAGSTHEFTFDHEGAVIAQAGQGVYFVGARASWYPRGDEGFATYDLTFHYPKGLTLVAPGDMISDSTTDDVRVTRWRTPTPVRIAGFNLGDYEKVSGTARGYTIQVYGNRHLQASLAPKPPLLPPPLPEPPRRFANGRLPAIAEAEQPPSPDPLARLRAVASDVSSSLNFFSSRFGPPALKTLTVAPIPGTFGQGFPGLVYLSTLSYLNPGQRPAAVRDSSNQIFFSDLMEAHEVAHQWWGNVVTTGAYQDEWMLEALSSYSALLWLEQKKGPKAVDGVLDSYRDDLLKKNWDGRTIESAGPITWGIRLNSTGIQDAWRAITYEKGAWICHMLRRRLGDAQFLKMLAELRRRYEFKSVTTQDFQALAKEFVPPGVPASSIDAFFENWVYSTGIPSLKVKYTVRGAAPGMRLSGTLVQSGVDDDFSVNVPVEIQFARGASRTIWVKSSSDPVTFSATLARAPLRVAVSSGILMQRK